MISWEEAIAAARDEEREEGVLPPPAGLFTRSDVLTLIEKNYPFAVVVGVNRFYDHLEQRGVNIYSWCGEHFGPEAFEWAGDDGYEYYSYDATARWARHDTTFCFKSEHDATLYKVMWG